MLKHKRDDNIVSSENVSTVKIWKRTNWAAVSKVTGVSSPTDTDTE